VRKLIVNALYDGANVLCRLADALSPTSDEIWRERVTQEYNDRQARAIKWAEDHPATVAAPGFYVGADS
jgi:hypothetical protein